MINFILFLKRFFNVVVIVLLLIFLFFNCVGFFHLSIVCPDGDTSKNIITMWTIISKVRIEAIMWVSVTQSCLSVCVACNFLIMNFTS